MGCFSRIGCRWPVPYRDGGWFRQGLELSLAGIRLSGGHARRLQECLDHCDPGNWNNHGSIVEFGGQWYIFYHRSTHGSKMKRKVCVEPITFNPDGSIDDVEMSSQGAGQPLDASALIEAERAEEQEN